MASKAERRRQLLEGLIKIEELKLLDNRATIDSLIGICSRSREQIKIFEETLGSGRYLRELSDLDISMYSMSGEDFFEYMENLKSVYRDAASMIESGAEYARELTISIENLKKLLAREGGKPDFLPRMEMRPDGTPYMVEEAAYSEPEDESESESEEFEYTHPSFNKDAAPYPGYSLHGGLKIKTPGSFDKN